MGSALRSIDSVIKNRGSNASTFVVWAGSCESCSAQTFDPYFVGKQTAANVVVAGSENPDESRFLTLKSNARVVYWKDPKGLLSRQFGFVRVGDWCVVKDGKIVEAGVSAKVMSPPDRESIARGLLK